MIFLSTIIACKPVSDSEKNSNIHAAVPQCIDSQSACEIVTDLATIHVKFAQHQLSDKVKTELPFFIELSQLPQENVNANITNISAHLEGRDMFMGKVPIFFEQTDNDNIYMAQSLLANCSEEQMVWRLWVTVEMTENTQNFFIDFTSQRL